MLFMRAPYYVIELCSKNNTAASPLYYVRGGHVTLDTGALRYAGLDSYYWSATTYPNATNAHYLDFSSTNVNPSYYSTRFYGFSVGWIPVILVIDGRCWSGVCLRS